MDNSRLTLLIYLLIIAIITGCAPALPKMEGATDKESVEVSRSVGQAKHAAVVAAEQAANNAAEVKKLHAEASAMLEEARRMRAECAAINKQVQIKRRAVQRRPVAPKPEAAPNPEYSPSDAPLSSPTPK